MCVEERLRDIEYDGSGSFWRERIHRSVNCTGLIGCAALGTAVSQWVIEHLEADMQGYGFLAVSLAILALGTALYRIGPALDRWDSRLKEALKRLESEGHRGRGEPGED